VFILKGLMLHQNCASVLSLFAPAGDERWSEAAGLTTNTSNVYTIREAADCQEKNLRKTGEPK
jgi:hypothetical protein